VRVAGHLRCTQRRGPGTAGKIHSDIFAAAFRAVLKVDKGSVMDLANLGLCEKFLGQKEAAMEHLAAALEVDPSLDFARTHLEELKASL
jgi:ribosomal protein S12 methylthiotransferase accessory factor